MRLSFDLEPKHVKDIIQYMLANGATLSLDATAFDEVVNGAARKRGGPPKGYQMSEAHKKKLSIAAKKRARKRKKSASGALGGV